MSGWNTQLKKEKEKKGKLKGHYIYMLKYKSKCLKGAIVGNDELLNLMQQVVMYSGKL